MRISRAQLLGGIFLFASCSRVDPGTRTYLRALEQERVAKDAFMVGDSGPLEAAHRAAFHGLRYFGPDPSWRLRAFLTTQTPADTVRFLTSQGTYDTFLHIGTAQFEHDRKPLALEVFSSLADVHYFVPFTDATSGRDTYGAGRYLDPDPPQADSLWLDFNRAYNPYCAYEASWVCPVPPPQNHLDIEVRAGERSPVDAH